MSPKKNREIAKEFIVVLLFLVNFLFLLVFLFLLFLLHINDVRAGAAILLLSIHGFVPSSDSSRQRHRQTDDRRRRRSWQDLLHSQVVRRRLQQISYPNSWCAKKFKRGSFLSIRNVFFLLVTLRISSVSYSVCPSVWFFVRPSDCRASSIFRSLWNNL